MSEFVTFKVDAVRIPDHQITTIFNSLIQFIPYFLVVRFVYLVMLFSQRKKPKKGLDGVAISELLDSFDILAYINNEKVNRNKIMRMHESIKEDQSVALQCFHKYDKIADHFDDIKKSEILADKNKIHSQVDKGEFKSLVLKLNALNSKICSYLSTDIHQLKTKV